MKNINTQQKRIKNAALSGVIFSVISLFISDLHTVADFLISRVQGDSVLSALPAGLEYLFYFTGCIASPILAVSLIVFGVGFLALYKQNAQNIALVCAVLIFISAASALFSGFADLRYALAVSSAYAAGTTSISINAGILRGISALIEGLIAGLALPITLYVFFKRGGNRIGKTGTVITLFGVILGIAVKSLALWVMPVLMLALFLLLMAIKSVGFILISAGLFIQSASNPYSENT